MLRRTLAHRLLRMPGTWLALRHYVRYAPPQWGVARINRSVNDYYAQHQRPFTTRTIPGFLITGDTRDFIQRHIFVYGVWEPHLSRWITEALGPGDGFVDVGANIGYFSLLASKIVGRRGRVISVEASPSIFKTLELNLRLNRARNVRAVNCAAADVTSVVRMFRAPMWNLGASTTFSKPGYEDEGMVEARPLHELLTTEEVGAMRIIKIDAEGAEVSIVKGLLPLFAHGRRDLELVVEVGGTTSTEAYSAAEAATRITMMAAAAGFNAYRIPNSYDAGDYVSRTGGMRPTRLDAAEAVTEECDLVFSRRDVAEL